MTGRDYAHATYRAQQERASYLTRQRNLEQYKRDCHKADTIAWSVTFIALIIGVTLLCAI